jgi:glycosyltransferase involved in cell wall biosynthesis
MILDGKRETSVITVITVVRNGEETIEKTILSVINQTYKNKEYVIVDGGSTDNTLKIIIKYKNRIDFMVSEADEGTYYAMNKGIDLASGKWINFMNSGDVFYNDDTIETLMHLLNLEDEIVYGNTMLKYGSDLFCDILSQVSPGNSMPFCHQSAFVRSELLKEHHFDVNYKICADRKFFFIMYQLGKTFTYVPKIVCTYDAQDGLSSRKPFLSFFEELDFKNEKFYFPRNTKILVYLIVKEILKYILPKKIYSYIRYKKSYINR